MTQFRSFDDLRRAGQSPWCDALSRGMLASGELARLMHDMGVTGVTSNPTIFQRALAGGGCYDGDIRDLARRGLGVEAIYEQLAVADIRTAADVLRPVHDATGGCDGHVSLEVSPELADDAAASITEARRLHRAVDRPNLLVKIPATAAGVRAVETLLGEGIGVNATLIFGLQRYQEILHAYVRGIDRARERGLDTARIASVASFFVSRVDTLVDRLLDERIAAADTARSMSSLALLKGTAAIDNARLAHETWRRFPQARRQRLLWASTGTKNPAYRDVVYVEELVGPDTVSTMPPETLAAFADHGRVRGHTLGDDARGSRARRELLADAGIDMEEVAAELEREGVRLFAESFALLRRQLAAKLDALAVGGRA